MAKRLHIFRAGKHTSSNGVTMQFTETMLQACVNAYNPSLHEAPIVVGHPKEDDPAYGWITSLSFSENNLEALPCKVDPQFAELVEAGRFNKISASFYLPDSPSNPVPGTLYLRHVGFLGAQPPAIKGLKSASFASHDEGVVEFADWGDTQNASLWRRMREFLIEKFSVGDADRVIPDYAVQTLEEAAREPAKTISQYTERSQESDTMNADQLATAQAKLEQDRATLDAALATLTTKEAAFAEREQSLSTQERAAQRVAFVAFTDALIADGRLLPVHKDGLVAFMDSLSASGIVEFGEGEAKKSIPSLDWLKSYLTAQPKLVHFGEHANGDVEDTVANFSAPKGYSIDADSAEVHSKALAHQKANPTVGYVDAVKAVTAG